MIEVINQKTSRTENKVLTETRENIVFADFWREATSIIDSFVRRCMSHVKAELSAYR